nr:putative reverse transcriptase, RNA-dependent DNA polymerase, Gag-polypeptide of LTR copia-type [Tanacetum cinerariifolium]
VTTNVNHINFLDNENPKKSNDDGRVSSFDDGTKLSSDYENDDDFRATSIDENTHPEGNVYDEIDLVDNLFENVELNSESKDFPFNSVTRSFRHTKLPTSLNDFIIDGKVKYGIERAVNYANLSSDNFCFATSLNKSIEPSCYDDAIFDNN